MSANEPSASAAPRGQVAPLDDQPLGGPLLALFITSVLALALKEQCVLLGYWEGSAQYTSGGYSDMVPFWGLRGVAEGKLPYFQAPIEYPVLTGLVIWIEGIITRLYFGNAAGPQYFLFVGTLVNAALALAVFGILDRLGAARQRLWMWAAGPPLILYLGHNWDMVAVAAAILAMLLAQRQQWVGAAAVAGLGGAAKLFPLLMLPLLVLAPLTDRDVRSALWAAFAGAAAWAAVNLPVMIFAFKNWSEFYTFSRDRVGTAASFWELAYQLGNFDTTVPERNLFSGIAFVIGAVLIVAFGSVHHRERLWSLFTPVLAWFMLINKVWSPQFDLWIYPAMLVTVRNPWPIMLFVVGDVSAYFAENWWFAGMEGAHPSATQLDILAAALIRGTALIWIIIEALAARALAGKLTARSSAV